METLLGVLRAAAESTRLRLLALCARSELTVGELTQILRQSQPRVSRHLKLLCEAGLLDRTREGTNAFYRLKESADGARVARYLVDSIPANDPTLLLDLDRLGTVKRSRAAAAAAYFRKNAARWDGIRALHVDETEVESALLKLMPSGEIHELLDVGTGTGGILRLVADRVDHAVGIDLSRDMLAVARANLEEAGLLNCAVRQGDMYDLPWPPASFDAVTLHLVLHYSDEPFDAIAESARVLRPGGRMVVVDFAPHNVVELRDEHAHRWSGFDDSRIEQWYRAAGMIPRDPVRLQGNPLTVCLWPAMRAPENANPADARSAEAGRADRRSPV
jgi:ArsR family transcriptional regulator